jgi:hypothetical protein
LLILNLFKESAEYNLAALLPRMDIKPVKGATFSIARYKIKLGFFLELNKMMSEHIQTLRPKVWKGFRLIAGDGTTVNLPPSPKIKEHFGIFAVSDDSTHTCLGNACMLYDVLSNLVVDTIISPCSIGEGTLLDHMLRNPQFSNAIILLDRGFGYFSTCKKIINKQLSFCIRLKTSQSDFAKNALLNPLTDFVTEWIPSEGERLTCRQNGINTEPVKVRVTKIILPAGEIEVLVSNLFIAAIDQSDMRELYGMRWGVEEGFKKLKPKMKLEQFGCRRYEGVYQEFYAHIFMMNLVTLIGNDAQDKIIEKTKGRKLKYKYNWQNAFRFVRNKFIDIFNIGAFQRSIECIIEQIANSITAIKKNRNFGRQMGGKRKNRYTQCYK